MKKLTKTQYKILKLIAEYQYKPYSVTPFRYKSQYAIEQSLCKRDYLVNDVRQITPTCIANRLFVSDKGYGATGK